MPYDLASQAGDSQSYPGESATSLWACAGNVPHPYWNSALLADKINLFPSESLQKRVEPGTLEERGMLGGSGFGVRSRLVSQIHKS